MTTRKRTRDEVATITCGICMDDTDTQGVLGHWVGRDTPGCGHDFCWECAQTWAGKSNLCPLCRVPFTRLTGIRLPGDEFKSIRVKKQHFEVDDESDDDSESDGAGDALPQWDEEWAVCNMCGACDNRPQLLSCTLCSTLQHTYCTAPTLPDDTPHSAQFFCHTCVEGGRALSATEPTPTPTTPSQTTQPRQRRRVAATTEASERRQQQPPPARRSLPVDPNAYTAHPPNTPRVQTVVTVETDTAPDVALRSEDARSTKARLLSVFAQKARQQGVDAASFNALPRRDRFLLLSTMGFAYRDVISLIVWIGQRNAEGGGGGGGGDATDGDNEAERLRVNIAKADQLSANRTAFVASVKALMVGAKLGKARVEECLVAVLPTLVKYGSDTQALRLLGLHRPDGGEEGDGHGTTSCAADESVATAVPAAPARDPGSCPVCAQAFPSTETAEGKRAHVNSHFT